MNAPDGAPRRIYLLRHGHVDSGGQRRYIGRTDLPLSPRGQEQARGLARDLAASGATRIYASDLRRAQDTARIIAAALGLKVILEPALREIDLGAWEGLTMDTVRHRDPESYRRRGEDLAGFRPPGGESFTDLARRVVPAFERIAASTRGAAIIVAHAGVNRVLLCHLLAKPLRQLFDQDQDHAAVTRIDYHGPRPVVRTFFQSSAPTSPGPG